MSNGELWIFLAIGAGVGFAGGLFAIGGALIAIPLLTVVLGFSQHESQGTAMLMALSSAAVTMMIYAYKGLLRFRDGIVMTICSIIASFGAAQLVRFIPDSILQHGFGIFLMVLAVFVWFGHLGESDEPRPLSFVTQGIIGVLAGILSGLFVIGGALVCVPLLEKVACYSQQRAQAMVLLILVPASVIGLAVYTSAGYVQWSAAIPLAIGAVILAPLGAKIALAMNPRLLRRCFALLQAGAGLLLFVSK